VARRPTGRESNRQPGCSVWAIKVWRDTSENALAHDEPVDRDTLARYHEILNCLVGRPAAAGAATVGSSRPDDVHAYRVHAWRDPRLELEMIANRVPALIASVADPPAMTRSGPMR